jgi:hypothetical protein
LKAVTATRLAQARAAASAKSKREDDINAATEPVTLEYRYKILDLQQRVTEQLPPQGLLHLRAWIDKMVSSTTIRLRGRAIEFFRRPR